MEHQTAQGFSRGPTNGTSNEKHPELYAYANFQLRSVINVRFSHFSQVIMPTSLMVQCNRISSVMLKC